MNSKYFKIDAKLEKGAGVTPFYGNVPTYVPSGSGSSAENTYLRYIVDPTSKFDWQVSGSGNVLDYFRYLPTGSIVDEGQLNPDPGPDTDPAFFLNQDPDPGSRPLKTVDKKI